MKAGTASAPSRRLELVLELYFLVALLSTSGLDNLVFLTLLLAGVLVAGRMAARIRASAVALLA
ncbi:MAG TPA: hypothetical protein VI455_10270 [Terriglobia bacterium]